MVLATKVDPLPGSRDFSGSRVRASVSESLQRLGLDHLQVVYLHDPEKITFTEATAPGGAVDALIQLREEGVIKLSRRSRRPDRSDASVPCDRRI